MTESGNEERLLTARQAAQYLGYSEGHVRNLASEGAIPSVKLGTGALRFRRSALDAWMTERGPSAEPASVSGIGAVSGGDEAA